jgi:hypothetical protein
MRPFVRLPLAWIRRPALALALALVVVVPAAAQSPAELIVAITSPAPGTTVNGRVRIEGWAVDPGNPPTSTSGINPRDIQLWLGPYPDGRLLDYAAFGLTSEPSMGFYGASYLRSGFERTWATCSFRPGPYELWVYVSSLSNPGVLGYNKLDMNVTPCAPGTEIYRADFRDAQSWRALSTTQVETGPDGNAWLIRRKVPGASGDSPEGVYANFRAEVTARVVGRPINRYYYIQFRQVPGPGDTLGDFYYRFSVDPDFGSFDLARFENEVETILIEETRMEMLIRPPEEENRLAVEADGPRISLFINGTKVGETADDALPWGRISFGVGSGGQPDAAARFTDFVITTP